MRRVVDRTINSSGVSLSSMNLRWIPYTGDPGGIASRRKTSKAWSFMGQLIRVVASDSDDTKIFQSEMSDLLYCRLCFEEQLADPHGLLAKVYCTATTTSSGNHLSHAASKHGVRFDKDPAAVRVKLEDEDLFDLQLSDNQSIAADGSGHAGSLEIPELDFKRDFVMLASADLHPMSVFDQPGFRTFCEKHTALELPSRFVLSTSALNDEFEALRTRIVDVLGSCVGGTLMLDSWSDGTTGSLGRRFLAVRLSFVQNWSFEVVTLAVKPVDCLDASATAPLVRDVAAQFLPQNGRRCLLFNASPDTADMRALSWALGHERINCVADSMNRLLTVDSLCRVSAIVQLLSKCRELVVAVHFHGCGVDGQRELDMQKHEFDMFEEMADVHELLRLDDRSPLMPDIEHEDNASERPSISTRWTVVLATVNAVLDNRRAVGEALRRAGRADLCPSTDDIELLTQLRDFLTPFQQFALLAAECSPNLSLVPLIRTRIERQCGQSTPAADDAVGSCGVRQQMDEVRQLVTTALDARLPLTDVVRLNICFDPAVRDVLLQSSECEDILTAAYRRFRDSPLAEHFPRTAVTSSVCPTSDDLLDDGDGSTAAKRLRLSLLMESSSAAMKTNDAAPSDREAGDEIRRYLTLHDDAPALEFWKRHADCLPILSVMASVYLAVCPGSVPFDRLFSSKGLVINNRLSSLPPYRVNMMAIVHDNCNSSLLLPSE